MNVFKRPSISRFFKKNLSSYLGKNASSQLRTGVIKKKNSHEVFLRKGVKLLGFLF